MSLEAIENIKQIESENRERKAAAEAEARQMVAEAERAGNALVQKARSDAAEHGKQLLQEAETRAAARSAEIAAASTVVLASYTGIPISTTHTLVGAILGVGLARGIAAIDLRVVRNIFMSWVITLPAGAILSVFFFYILKAIFS